MTIVSEHAQTGMAVRYQVGVTSEGSPITRMKSLAKVKESASNEDIHAVTTALFDLLDFPDFQPQTGTFLPLNSYCVNINKLEGRIRT